MIRIEPLSLEPIHIRAFADVHGSARALAEPLVLHPVIDEESGQQLLVSDARLGLYASAATRDDLVEECQAILGFLVTEFVDVDEDSLTPKAKRHRAVLKKLLGAVDAVDAP